MVYFLVIGDCLFYFLVISDWKMYFLVMRDFGVVFPRRIHLRWACNVCPDGIPVLDIRVQKMLGFNVIIYI